MTEQEINRGAGDGGAEQGMSGDGMSAGTPTGRTGTPHKHFASGDHLASGDKGQRSALQRWTTYLLLMPLMAAATVIFGTISLLTSLWDSSGRQQHRIAQSWARLILRMALSPIEVIHPERLRMPGAAVYASNHLSYMDTPALFGSLPFQFRILANHYLFRYPFIGWHLARSGQVPIDQSSLRSQIAGLTKGVAALKSGMPILLFPEGSRSPDGSLGSFLSGAAFMAIRAQVPVVPLTLVGTHELLPMHTYSLAPRPLKLIVGEPIHTTGLTTRQAEALTQQIFGSITAMYGAHGNVEGS